MNCSVFSASLILAASLATISISYAEEITPPYLAGTVLNAEGEPVESGLIFWNPQGAKSYQRLTNIGDGGKFAVSVKDKAVGWSSFLVVRHGNQIGWGTAQKFLVTEEDKTPRQTEIQLLPTTDFNLTVKTEEGEPVADLDVRVTRCWEFDENPLDEFLEEREEANFDDVIMRTSNSRVYAPHFDSFGLLPQATTNKQGKATIAGLPENCLVQLLIVGEKTEAITIYVRTDGGEQIKVPYEGKNPNSDLETFYANEAKLTAKPSIPIRGTVTNLETREPMAGTDVRFYFSRRAGIIVDAAMYRNAVTDEQGHFEILGTPIERTRVYVDPISQETPFLSIDQYSRPKPDMDEVVLNFEVPTGVKISGFVRNDKTGEPVEGSLRYYSLKDNPAAKQMAPSRLGTDSNGTSIKEDGSYSLDVLPGPGFLAVRARGPYIRGQGIEQLDSKALKKIGTWMNIDALPYSVIVQNYEYYQPIHPLIGEDLKVDIEVPGPSISIPLEFVNHTNNRFSQVYYTGQTNETLPFNLVVLSRRTEYPSVIHFFDSMDDQRRLVQARTSDHKLAGWMFVTRDQEVAKLDLYESSSVVGRLINQDGSPVVGARIRNDYWKDASLEKGYMVSQPDTGYTVHTDKEGKFEIIGLAADLPISTRVSVRNEKGRSTIAGYLFKDLKLKRGETTDLGDLIFEELQPIERDE